ncbi:hypothetical protein MXE68_26275 [Escherichia coli]|nr:hypothetical protein [Escherichia coli]
MNLTKNGCMEEPCKCPELCNTSMKYNEYPYVMSNNPPHGISGYSEPPTSDPEQLRALEIDMVPKVMAENA